VLAFLFVLCFVVFLVLLYSFLGKAWLQGTEELACVPIARTADRNRTKYPPP